MVRQFRCDAREQRERIRCAGGEAGGHEAVVQAQDLARVACGHIRDVQDRAVAAGRPGFTAFIPWSYKRENTALGRRVKNEAGASEYLRVIALSRVFLDNVAHIQASWFSEGRKTGQVALHFGADDIDGTVVEERITHAAGASTPQALTVARLRRLIEEAGRDPVERNTLYQRVIRSDAGEWELAS